MLPPDPTPLRPAVSAPDFTQTLCHFIERLVPSREPAPRGPEPIVRPETPLFATGLLDSLSILHLIAAIEDLTGQAVPDALVIMKHFQTVEAITATFWKPQPQPENP